MITVVYVSLTHTPSNCLIQTDCKKFRRKLHNLLTKPNYSPMLVPLHGMIFIVGGNTAIKTADNNDYIYIKQWLDASWPYPEGECRPPRGAHDTEIGSNVCLCQRQQVRHMQGPCCLHQIPQRVAFRHLHRKKRIYFLEKNSHKFWWLFLFFLSQSRSLSLMLIAIIVYCY